MFINRPLINGRSLHKEGGTRNHSSVTDNKNKIRIKTLPPSVHHHGRYGQQSDMAVIEGNLIGIKDIREMMDGDVKKMIERLEQLEEDTENDEKRLQKGYSKMLSKKSTIKSPSPSSTVSLKDNKQIKLQEQEEKAYRQCVQLLAQQRKQQLKVHEKLNQQLSRKYYELSQTRIQLQQLRKAAIASLQQAKLQLNRVQQDIKLVQKRGNNRERLNQEIALQKQKIIKMNEKLFTSKQQSMKQKNQFVQIQAEQIRLVKEIQGEDEEEMKCNEEWEQFQYYKKIQKLKGKLLKQKQKQGNEVDQFFKEKIAAIAKVRVTSDQMDEKINSIVGSIQEQQAVIQMLNKKSQTQEQIETKTQTAQLKYVKNYTKIFNSASRSSINHQQTQPQSQTDNDFREIDHWQNYKFYLEKILKNQKKLQLMKDNPSEISSYTNKDDQFDRDYQHEVRSSKKVSSKLIQSSNFQNGGINTQKHKKKPSLPSAITSNQFTPTRTNQKKLNHPNPSLFYSNQNNKAYEYPVSRHQVSSLNNIQNQKEKSITPLPKLVKMEGNLSDKDKIKNQLTKFTNHQLDEQVELETVRTSQCDGEDVIEVQFKGIKPKKK